jgi:ligand-binding SRPBCC domain-containing protein
MGKLAQELSSDNRLARERAATARYTDWAMKIFTFESKLYLPVPIDKVFPFFAEAHNLELLTPPFLQFKIISPTPIAMGRGAHIRYRLKLRGIPITWESEITAWDPPHRFVDEQLRGPYRLWKHQHTFVERDGGTDVSDHVDYAVWGGSLVNSLLVAPDVKKIFEYRRSKLEELLVNKQRG